MALALGFRRTRLNVLHWMSWCFALGLELVLVVLLRDGVIYAWEQDLTRVLQETPARQAIFDVANFLTNTLSVPFLIIFIAVVSLVFRFGHRLDAGLLLLTFPLHVLAQFPKALIDRPRPSDAYEGIVGVGGLQSFPSGHAEFVVNFYGFLTYLAVLRLDRRWQQAVVILAWFVLAASTGLGRIATGRHWPIDIFSSYLFGAAILSGLIWLRRCLRQAIDQVDAAGPQADAGRVLARQEP